MPRPCEITHTWEGGLVDVLWHDSGIIIKAVVITPHMVLPGLWLVCSLSLAIGGILLEAVRSGIVDIFFTFILGAN